MHLNWIVKIMVIIKINTNGIVMKTINFDTVDTLNSYKKNLLQYNLTNFRNDYYILIPNKFIGN